MKTDAQGGGSLQELLPVGNAVVPQTPFRGFSDTIQKNERGFKHARVVFLLSLAIEFGNTLQLVSRKFKETGRTDQQKGNVAAVFSVS